MWKSIASSRTPSKARLRLSLGAALLLLTQSPICLATIYKCIAQDGGTTYADAPCAPDAKPQPGAAGDNAAAMLAELVKSGSILRL
jgi:hypothetical protein